MGHTGREVQEAYQSAKKSIGLSRDEFVKKVQDQLDAIDEQMDMVKNKIDQKSGEAKADLQEQWDRLKQKKQKLQDQIDEVEAQSKENWNNLKENINYRLDSLKSSFTNLKDKLGIDS
ncbi:MAG: hypothetical protein PVH63_04495 [Balneolaceae bacterium]|jgi:chromosome segregation ATPase